MRNSERWSLLGLLLVFLVLAGGLAGVFQLRYQRGDVYPAYSSYRSDPLGLKLLYESFSLVPGMRASRNLEPDAYFAPPPQVTLLLAGVEPSNLTALGEEEAAALDRLFEKGGRLVVAMALQAPIREVETTEAQKKEEAEAKAKKEAKKTKTAREKEKKKDGAEEERVKTVDLEKQWSFQTQTMVVPANALKKWVGEARRADEEKEERTTWLSARYFVVSDAAWQIRWTCEGKPVVIERAWKGGRMVLCSDSYFLSNEGLVRDRSLPLLMDVLGSGRNLLFDETHLGISRNPGLMSLVWRYRLQGFFIGAVVWLGLFIWKNSVPLVREGSEGERANVPVTGREAHVGFINLLRRSVAPRDLPATLQGVWKKSWPLLPHRQTLPSQRPLVEARLADPEAASDPTKLYQDIYQLIQNTGKHL
jgi:hypothetical protein